MYLFYIDESHSPQAHIDILAGPIIFERQTFWIAKELDKIASQFAPWFEDMPVELHGSPMFSGHKRWRTIPRELRHRAIEDALDLIYQTREIRLLASCIRHADTSSASSEKTLLYNFEQVITRFDHFLTRQFQYFDEKARGLAIFDKKDKYEQRLQTLVRNYTHQGHRWGKLRNYAEVPLFIDSQSSRLIQLADLVAFALNRYFAQNDNRLYRIIQHSFDTFQGRRHGLHTKGLNDGADPA